MKVLIAQKCGFCHGVRNAIKVAKQTLEAQQDVYCLGPIIHNRDMVEQLSQNGLKTVDSVDEIMSGTVLIRSHGAAPDQIKKLKEKGLNIVDATCVLVKRVQHIASEFAKEGYKVVIIGEEDHPEVKAVVGCAEDVIVITDESDIYKLPEHTKLGIVCQTTQNPEHFGKMLGAYRQMRFQRTKSNQYPV